MLFYLKLFTILTLLLHIKIIVGSKEDVANVKAEIQNRLYCSVGLHDKNCAINGDWNYWSLWGPCVGECGQVGLKWRTRECNNPAPSNNGAFCIGNNHESKECRLKACTLEEYKDFVKCDLVRSQEFKIIENIDKTYPALTTKCLETECHYKTVHNILQDYTDLYWNALHCVKHNIGCPEYGGWGNWEEWSDCSAHCGFGKQIRCRYCDNPLPTNPNYKCLGENCTTMQCIGTNCDIKESINWAEWSTWSTCSVSCGQGFSKRVRKCVYTDVTTEKEPRNIKINNDKYSSKFFQKFKWHKKTNHSLHKQIMKRKKTAELIAIVVGTCKGPYEELKPCYLIDCPIDGEWSEWEPWTQCSAGCGLGTQSRNRACSSPPASGGGQPCRGPITHIRHCFLNPCKTVTHKLAVFLGEGSLRYYKTGTPIRLLHLYIKFRPSGSSGDLIRRETLIKNEKHSKHYVRLYLEAGYIVFSVRFSKCYLSIISQRTAEHDKWTEVMIMVTPSGATMRVDNSFMYYTAKFNHALKRANFDSEMIIGYNFKGEIEKLAVNFKKINLWSSEEVQTMDQTEINNLAPFSITNVDFTESERDSGLVSLDNLLYAPCPKNKNSWTIEFVIKTQATEGAVLMIKDYYLSKFLIIIFEPHRITLRLVFGDCVTETDHIIESHKDLWTYISIDYNETKAIGLRLNGGRRKRLNSFIDGQELTCKDNIFLGHIAHLCKNTGLPNNSFITYMKSMTGILALLKIDGEDIDLETLPSQNEHGKKPFLSETISYSNKYTELQLPYGEQLNLSCLYSLDVSSDDLLSRQQWNQSKPFWLKFDTPIDTNNTNSSRIQYDIYEDNRLCQLQTLYYKSRDDIEGFYSCWLPNPKKINASNILFTYGITVVKTYSEFEGFSTVLIRIIQIFFLIIFLSFSTWLIYEYYDDSRKGRGIFTLSKTINGSSKEDKFILKHSINYKERLS